MFRRRVTAPRARAHRACARAVGTAGAFATLVWSPLGYAESPDRADPFGPQLTWAPVLEIRGRIEGQGTPLPDTRAVGQVARVGLEAERGILSARVSLQEVRAWTADRDGLTLSGSFVPELAEGWARIEGTLSDNVGARLTIGRQPIEIDEGRLVGRKDWLLEGQFLDAMRFELMAAPVSFEVVNARRFETDPEDSDADPFSLGVTVLRLGVARQGGNADGKLDLLSVVDARHTTALTSTTGFYGTLSMGRGLGMTECYFQQNAAGTGSLMSGELGWVLGRRRAWVVRARYTAASGKGSPGGLATFQPVLGDEHDQYGLLDVLGPGDDPRGLSDAAIKAELQASARLELKAEAHRLGPTREPAAYGYEADLSIAWHITPYAALDLGAGVIGAGELGLRAGGYAEIGVDF